MRARGGGRTRTDEDDCAVVPGLTENRLKADLPLRLASRPRKDAGSLDGLCLSGSPCREVRIEYFFAIREHARVSMSSESRQHFMERLSLRNQFGEDLV